MAVNWCCFRSENGKRSPELRGRSGREAAFVQAQFGPRNFSYEQLRQATNDFGVQLGVGASGTVYKGKLDDGGNQQFVAVKRFHWTSGFCEKEFIAEAGIISRLNHRNVLKLIGWCRDEGQFLLVYEYMPNGSLADVLHNNRRCLDLDWDRRFEIAKGLGSVLHYLHADCGEEAILHRDVKSSNVLLNESFIPKLGDFGLSRQVQKGEIWHSTLPGGTWGYIAPEMCYGDTPQRATQALDVYAFGIVLLELVTGKKPLDESMKGCLLVDWVWVLYEEEKELEAVDQRLQGQWEEDEARRMLVVGLACSHPDKQERLKIKAALHVLEGAANLPDLPRLQPKLTFRSPVRMEAGMLVESSRARESDSVRNYFNPPFPLPMGQFTEAKGGILVEGSRRTDSPSNYFNPMSHFPEAYGGMLVKGSRTREPDGVRNCFKPHMSHFTEAHDGMLVKGSRQVDSPSDYFTPEGFRPVYPKGSRQADSSSDYFTPVGSREEE